uniref:Filamentous hemagglutinin family N-terminal domain-containing protein n=1 Tax=Candidatus Kentrum sp. DK TaxID=2126562 RepID=A0A450TE69_9GAMM|nr:MAG: filamentous hemagglutinin family N-terminal domain-containing protein [Candidatus Kentron sp. DK]
MHRNRLNPKALYSVTATDDQYKVTTKTRKSKRIFRQFTLSGMICAVLGQVPVSYAGDITPDGTTQTAIDQAQNGVRVVDIAPPTQGGVSHNKYTGFNVEKTGAIMNNSLDIGVSQLGGALPANPHFTDRTADIILNEVTSTQRSELKGYTEIFGDRAEYILANPNGITCSGCGFINTSRLGLVTGTPRLDVEGKLDDIAIGQGDVLIEGEGMNAENVRYVDIVTRVAKIQGELIAGDEINIHTGNDRFDYKTRTVSSDPNKTPTEGTTFSVDASALGSMYAGKIQIVSTEAGFGVRDDATLMANVDDLVITAEGDITYTNALAERDIALQARDSITQTGISQAGNGLQLTAGEGITFSGSSVTGKGMARSGGDMEITAGSTVDNAAHRLSVGGNLKLAATTLDNRDGGEIEIQGNLVTEQPIASVDNRGGVIKGLNAGTKLELNVRDALDNDGGSIISAGNIGLIIGADYALYGTLSADQTLSVAAHGLRNFTRLDAGDMLRLTAAGGFFNEPGAVLASDRDIEATAAQAITNKGEITSDRNIRLEAKGGNLTNETGAKVTGGAGTTTLLASSAVINRDTLSSARGMAITASELSNYGQIATGRDLTATVSGNLYNTENTLLFAGQNMTLNVGGTLDNDRADIYAQDDMTLRGLNGGNSASIRNFVGTIESGGNMTIRTDALDNLAEEYDPDTGGYYGYNVARVNKGGRGWNYYNLMIRDEPTSTLRARPAYLTAGGNISIYDANTHNYSSVISAHGDLVISGGNLTNETASETTVALDRKWGKEWDEPYRYCYKITFGLVCKTKYRRKSHEYWDTYTTTVYAQEQATLSAGGTINISASRVDNGPLGTSVAALNDPSHTTAYNTASLQQIQETGYLDLSALLTLPTGEHGFFLLNQPDTEHTYLIESNVEFTDTTQFVGSEYFLDRMGVDLNENLRLMGDAVVETRLVERAILQVTHNPFLNGELSDSAEQMRRLYDDAFAEAARFEQEGMPLTVGVALSPEQVKSLRHDILWLEEREIAGARVLAPQLYLSQTTLAQIETGTGPVISGGDVLLATEEDFGNRGLITARQDIGISSEGSFTNVGSVDAGASLVVDVEEDIVNRGPGSLYGGDLVALYAGGDVRNESTVEEVHLGEDIVSRMKDIASIGSGGDLILNAGGDVVQRAAKLNATGSALIEAEGDIRFETIALRNKSVMGGSSSTSLGAGEFGMGAAAFGISGAVAMGAFGIGDSSSSYSATYDRTEHIGSEAVFGGDLIMTSGGDTTLTASRLEAGGGADVTTGGSFNLLSAQNTYHSESHYEYDNGFFGGSGSEDSVSDRTQQVSSVLKTGGDLSVDSKNNIMLLASTIESGGVAALKAKNNINVLNGYDTEYQRTQSSKSGFISAKQTDKGSLDDTVVASVIKSGGDLSFDAGGNVALIGSELDTEQDLSFGTFTVGRDAEGNLMTDEYGHYVAQDGSTVGSLVIASAEERHESWNIVKKQSYLTAMVVGPLVVGPVGMLLAMEGAKQGLFAEVEEDEYRQRSTRQVSSLLDVEGNLLANTEGDITVIGSEVQVAGSGAIHAGGDVNILSAEETDYHDESHRHVGMNGLTGGWDGSRLSIGLEGEYTKDTLTETAVTQKKSELNFDGGLLLNTEGAAMISASDIETGGSMTIQADAGLAVVSADDVQTTEQEQTKGEAKITYGIGNAYNDAYLAVKAAAEAAENVKRAKKALDAFDDEIAQMREDLKQGLVTEEDIRERKADRKYLVTNLVMATANAANARIQVGAAGAKAAGTAETFGFYADVKMEVDGTKSRSRSEQTTVVGSSLIAGGDMSLSSGADLHIQGSDAMASGVMDLLAAEDVLIESAQNTYREDSASEQTHMEIGMGTAGPTSWNASYNQANSNASGTSQRNSRVQAGAINISSGDDTTVAGAQVQAIDLAVDVGGNLTVASRQNKDRSSSNQIGASIGSGSIGVSGGQGYGLRKWVDQQTELVGTGSVAITTGGNTHLKGATIANRAADGTDGGNLMLRTANLTVEEIKDIDKANQWSAGITTGGSTSLQMGLSGHKTAQVNYATIGQGNVLTDGSEATVDGLNRDITQTTRVLANRKTGGLDFSVSVDHRVFSKGGRQSIAMDFYDTYDHANDIGDAVGDYFDPKKDVSLSHYSRVVGDGARKRSYLKSAVFYEEDTREGLNQADADAEEVQTAMQSVADGLTGQEGTKVVIYDGDPNAIGIDGNLPTDNTQFNKNLAKGGYSSASDGIGVNAYQTDMTSTDDKLQVIGHESYRAIADKQGYGYNAQTERAVAYRYGESVRDTWNAYSAIGGYQTNQNAGSTSGADWLSQNRSSSVIASGNEWIGRQDSQEMKPIIDTVWDAGNIAYDVGRIIYGKIKKDDELVKEGTVDLAVDSVALAIPGVVAGMSKLTRVAKKASVLKKGKDWADLSGKLRNAAKGKGNFGIGTATREQADAMGKAWVGDGYKVASDGKTLVSKDGLKQYRPPTNKPKIGKTQANFEQRFQGQKSKSWQSNAHLDIMD